MFVPSFVQAVGNLLECPLLAESSRSPELG